jgi:hypothetical protein
MLDERDEFLLSRYPDGDLTEEERAHVETLLAQSDEARQTLRQYRQLSGLLRLGREQPDVDHDALRQSIVANLDRDAMADVAGEGDEHETTRAERTALRLSSRTPASKLRLRTWGTESERVLGLRVRKIRRGVALAACAVLAVGLSWQVYRTASPLPSPDPVTTANSASSISISIGHSGSGITELRTGTGMAVIEGPRAEQGRGPAVAEINIGVSPAAHKSAAALFYQEERFPKPARIAITPSGPKAPGEDARNPF